MNALATTLLPTAGVLHSAERLLEMLTARPLSAEQLITDFNHILICPPHVVLNLSQRCGWIEAQADGLLIVSSRGTRLLSATGYEFRLRQQMMDYIVTEKPPWGRLLSRGRSETSQFAPREIVQVFREAGLMQVPPSDDAVGWWDDVARYARGAADSVRNEIGRTGERHTINRERRRTGKEPFWQAIESNLSGFDVLSVVAADCSNPLRIEVKTSGESIEYAMFHVSRNEWEAATNGVPYIFHLWCLRDEQMPRVAEIDVQAIETHAPHDCGEGTWEKTKIPFRVFREKFVDAF